MGGSYIWYGINTPFVNNELSRKEGRETVVTSLCWQWFGFDAVYFILKDLLQNRKVKMLVICDDYRGGAFRPHTMAHRWFRFGEDAGELDGLPFSTRFSYYASAILGMPRNLLCLLRSNLSGPLITPKKNLAEIQYGALNPATRLGSLGVQLGYGYSSANFTDYKPETAIRPSDTCTYTQETKEQFQFNGLSTNSLQLFFLRKIVTLAQEHHTKLVILHFPIIAEMGSQVIPEDAFLRELLGKEVRLVGVSGKKLFAGLTKEEVLKLYCNDEHLNRNGQEYFTPIITPTLLRIYDPETDR